MRCAVRAMKHANRARRGGGPRRRGWIAALAAMACATGASGAEQAPPVRPWDDTGLTAQLTTNLAAIHREGGFTAPATLRKQMSRSRHPMRLPAPPTRPLAMARIYETARQGVLIHCHYYKCKRCAKAHVNISTCFAIRDDGVCVANYHAFEEKDNEMLGEAVATSDGRVFPVVEVLAASAGNDVAVFRVDGRGFHPLVLSPDEPVGNPVAVVSHPTQLFYLMTQGVVARYFMAREQDGKYPRMAVTADYAKGSSGGPVLNQCGAVVGVVSSTRSIYYEEHGDKQENLQMVIKSCIPARSVLKLIE